MSFLKKESMKNPSEFYAICSKEFHDLAAQNWNLAPRGAVFVPELLDLGETTVLSFLNDLFFQMEFRSNPQQYYFVVNTMCFMAGIVFGDKWHRQASALKNGFAEEVIQDGPPDYAAPILENVVGLTAVDCDNLYQKLYQRWMDLHDPYWKLEDPRAYTFKLLLASYQLGVSIVLAKYGL